MSDFNRLFVCLQNYCKGAHGYLPYLEIYHDGSGNLFEGTSANTSEVLAFDNLLHGIYLFRTVLKVRPPRTGVQFNAALDTLFSTLQTVTELVEFEFPRIALYSDGSGEFIHGLWSGNTVFQFNNPEDAVWKLTALLQDNSVETPLTGYPAYDEILD